MASGIKFEKWRAPQITDELGRILESGMSKAVQFLVSEVKRSISQGQPRRRLKSGRQIGLSPSREGQPPKVLTSRLRSSITGQTGRKGTKIIGAYGSGVAYARRLELGFHGRDSAGRIVSQGPRPYLRPPLLENKDRIVKLLING